METAIWIIAAIEVIRALQNAMQLYFGKKADKRMDKAFIGSQAIDRELTRMIAEQAGVQKTGTWRHYGGTLKCSECSAEYYDDIKEHCGDDVPEYCPNCGAHMTKGEND